ncbi:MAG TPA: hypothetical protein VFY72_08450 [Beijerinckiaceae bacterium]|nr:hypothetical protein [Beijerinckiaceae bacterium]
MVSPALVQLFEQVRAHLGVDVEVLDASLRPVYPDMPSGLGRLLRDAPDVHAQLQNVIDSGRTHDVQHDGASYRFYPLRGAAGRREVAGLLAVRRTGALAPDAEPWSELAHAVVEAELVAADNVAAEQQHARRLSGTLRFVTALLEAGDEATVAQFLTQAAAIWFDADARVYRRTLRGVYALHTALPAIQAEDAPLRLPLWPEAAPDAWRGTHTEAAVIGGQAALIFPLASAAPAEWALAVMGSESRELQSILGVVARAAGARLEALAHQRYDRSRDAFLGLIVGTQAVTELGAMRLLHELARQTAAAAGSITLIRGDRARRIATIGSGAARRDLPVSEPVTSAGQLARRLTLPSGDAAVIELTADEPREFPLDAVRALDACGSVLGPWLAGSESRVMPAAVVFDGGLPAYDAGFTRRIQEELDRAKRFDLRLCLVVVDLGTPSPAVAELQHALRQELRGSDVTGTTSSRQVAALLTHTDAVGLETVVRRLKERLVDAADRLNVRQLRLGQAAYSSECGTVEALLTLASSHAEPLIVH